MRAMVIAAICALLWLPSIGAARASRPSSLAIAHVTVIDATGASARHDMTVLILGDLIVRVAPGKSVSLATDTVRIAGPTRFVIPGLWDMHTHRTPISSAVQRSVKQMYVLRNLLHRMAA